MPCTEFATLVLLLLVIYAGSYAVFRQTNQEVWPKDNQTYVIFPSGTIGQALDTQPEIVAHHLTQTGLTEPAIEWWENAGQRSLRRSAYSEAIAHLQKALRLADGLADGLADSSRQRLLRLRLQTSYS